MFNYLFILRILLIVSVVEFSWIEFSIADEKVVVELSNGKAEGHLVKNGDGSEGWVFLGIPYAEPPIGKLRFAEPKWKKSWKGILPCHGYKPACWQNVSGSGEFEETVISEDCLYANIFVGRHCLEKSLNGSRNKFDRLCPIIYYIHGGGYEFDSPRMFKPEILIKNFASKDIIFVTLAYRLNVFGFWTSGTDEALGNWALKDMIHGAKWIKKEIERFGGDASRTTVQGHSSSAMAISLLTLSPKTYGLFHQAIMMSGDSARITLPRIDGPNGLLPDTIDILAAERRPLTTIIGTVKNENGFNKFVYWNATRRTIVENCKAIIEREKWKRKEAVTNRCVSFYTNNISIYSDPIDSSNRHSFPFWAERTTTLLEDDDYFAPCHRDASSLTSKNSRVYLYSFDYEKIGLEGLTPYHSFDLVFYNGLHADDFEGKFDDRDRQVGERYVNLFINFALYGQPTPWPVDQVTWTPLASPWSFNYMSIDTKLTMRSNYHEPSVWLWNWELPHIDDNIPIIIDEKRSFPTDLDDHHTDGTKFGGKWIVVLAFLGVAAAIAATIVIFKWTNIKRSCDRQPLLQNKKNLVNVAYESLV
uniref:Carboxylesterase type B domain-containing protein n=1 Tax=Romanomermis culicivorax TaxID=13658 RepID=A0A915L120_ROMCU